jgi:hypothetical protein
MNTQLNELEAKLQKLFDDCRLNDSRAVFDIGVQFGTFLKEQNIEEYEYIFWNSLKEKNNKEKLIWEAIDAINDFLLRLVRNSIKDYINKNGSWSIAKENWSSEYDEFDIGTRRKYCVQISRVDMTQYGGDFECTFKVVGRLAKLFKKYNIYEQFEVSINNESGGEHTSVHKVERVSSIVSRLNCHVRNSNNWELEQYKDFLHVISKDFLFDLIKEA